MKSPGTYLRFLLNKGQKFRASLRFGHLFWIAGFLLLLLLGIESYFGYQKTAGINHQGLMEKALTQAEHRFDDIKEKFIRDTRRAGSDLCEVMQVSADDKLSRRLSNTLQYYDTFWGASVYKNKELWLWHGYAQASDIGQLNILKESLTLDIRKKNNVLYLRAEYPLSCNTGDTTQNHYLITSRRLEQENALASGVSTEMSLLQTEDDLPDYPVHFSFFESVSDTNIRYRKIAVGAIDSVGIAYTLPGDYQKIEQQVDQTRTEVRRYWALGALLLIALFLIIWSQNLGKWHRFGIHLLSLFLFWSGFKLLGGLSQFMPAGILPARLIDLLQTSFFLILIGVRTVPFLIAERRLYGFQWYPRTLFISIFYGFVAAYSLQYLLSFTYQLVLNTNTRPFDLQIFPETETTLLYLGTGLLTSAVLSLLVAGGWFILNSEEDQMDWVFPSILIGFFTGLWLGIPFDAPDEHTLLFTLVVFATFAALLGCIYFFYYYPQGIRFVSRIRLLVLGCFIVSIIIYPFFYRGFFDRMEHHLLSEARQLVNERDQKAEEITRTLLKSIRDRIEENKDGLDGGSRFRLQMFLSRSMNNLVSMEWNKYAISGEVINTTGVPIARYATHVNSFHTIRQIELPFSGSVMGKDSLYIQPLQQFDQPNTQQFQTFYFGLTPVELSMEQEESFYIRIFVYQERPNYNKPLQSVLTNQQYQGWKASVYLAEFVNGRSVRHLAPGIHYYYPKFDRLPEEKEQAVQRDSAFFQTIEHEPRNYRELIYRPTPSGSRTILANVALPGFRNHLFSFFRYYFALLTLGLLLLFFTKLLRRKSFNLWVRRERFQNRILDSYLIATLLFLGVLVFITHFIIQRQNERNAERELLNKLNRINSTVQTADQELSSELLNRLTANNEVDAALYKQNRLEVTTTPEIYRQNMLPEVLPYRIYRRLYQENFQQSLESLTLAGQPMMVGYQQLKGPKGEPAGILAIPTFIRSPKYEEQLLDTTSYLLAFYVIIFGLFIGGTAIIARRLTRPLEDFQSGLKRISAGHLDTTIPVTTRDEIGALANAYNLMVYKLKDLQEELAEAERQAAWTEMARQIAHEIKNPLTPMKLNLQHLKRKIAGGQQSPEEINEYIQEVTDNLIDQIESLNTIASDFSRFAKPIEEEFSRENLNDILSSVTDLYQHDKKIHISADLSREPLMVNCAPDELRRVFINLVKNSTEALPKGGVVMLRSYRHQNEAIVEVVDNGEGIPEQAQPKIFVPNFSTKSSGTGLGLAISKKIVEAHKGDISFASVIGSGTTFTIELPISKEKEESESSSNSGV